MQTSISLKWKPNLPYVHQEGFTCMQHWNTEINDFSLLYFSAYQTKHHKNKINAKSIKLIALILSREPTETLTAYLLARQSYSYTTYKHLHKTRHTFTRHITQASIQYKTHIHKTYHTSIYTRHTFTRHHTKSAFTTTEPASFFHMWLVQNIQATKPCYSIKNDGTCNLLSSVTI